ncbi:MAG: RIP metalloprotease RseP [Bacteroidota bacterium]|nr:RIP metalloprotease RseP [Bacteroidota bacterium]MDX5430369.1 RIP metalloprotease RseP [Bacteroidota bacterium]MDX5469130.1 RIP metalloprotease RseP [Bacteroidota bacterium]
MNALVMAGQMILALSILISLHELGHFLAARAFGIKVEKFYLFFDAWGIKLFSIKKGDTEYGIGWLPLGGYVKIAGMIDESMDTEQLKSEPKPWEFRSKPAWQRLIVMLAGVTVNIILGVVIYSGSLLYFGDQYLLNEDAKYGIQTSKYARELGFRDGDHIVAINDQEIVRFNEILNPAHVVNKAVYTVKRGDSVFTIALPDSALKVITSKKSGFLSLRQTFYIETVSNGSNAEKAGMQANDRILEINHWPAQFFYDFKDILYHRQGQVVQVKLLRGIDTLMLPVEVAKDGVLGFKAKMDDIGYQTEYPGLVEAFQRGNERAFSSLLVNIQALGKIFSGDVDPTKSLMGPIALATVFGSDWDWQNFWGLTGLLSMVLAFMNVLPIPALDGGHALFLLVEMAIRRPLGDKFMQVTQVIGMVILLSLMVFVFGNDIWNLLPR